MQWRIKKKKLIQLHVLFPSENKYSKKNFKEGKSCLCINRTTGRLIQTDITWINQCIRILNDTYRQIEILKMYIMKFFCLNWFYAKLILIINVVRLIIARKSKLSTLKKSRKVLFVWVLFEFFLFRCTSLSLTLTIASYDLQSRVGLLQVFDHVDLINWVPLRGVLLI